MSAAQPKVTSCHVKSTYNCATKINQIIISDNSSDLLSEVFRCCPDNISHFTLPFYFTCALLVGAIASVQTQLLLIHDYVLDVSQSVCVLFVLRETHTLGTTTTTTTDMRHLYSNKSTWRRVRWSFETQCLRSASSAPVASSRFDTARRHWVGVENSESESSWIPDSPVNDRPNFVVSPQGQKKLQGMVPLMKSTMASEF